MQLTLHEEEFAHKQARDYFVTQYIFLAMEKAAEMENCVKRAEFMTSIDSAVKVRFSALSH